MRALSVCLMIVALSAPGLLGQGKGKGKNKPKENGQAQAAVNTAVRFSTGEIKLIQDYYRPKVQQLPPGLEKKLQRGGTLPPGWQKKVQPFPHELVGRLGPVPAGCSRVISGRTALLIEDATNVVMDILELTR